MWGEKGLAHKPFAEHICGEVLTDIAIGEKGKVYQWSAVPGRIHDWGDAVYMAYAGAAALGISSSGVTVPARKKRQRRKPRFHVAQ